MLSVQQQQKWIKDGRGDGELSDPRQYRGQPAPLNF